MQKKLNVHSLKHLLCYRGLVDLMADDFELKCEVLAVVFIHLEVSKRKERNSQDSK